MAVAAEEVAAASKREREFKRYFIFPFIFINPKQKRMFSISVF